MTQTKAQPDCENVCVSGAKFSFCCSSGEIFKTYAKAKMSLYVTISATAYVTATRVIRVICVSVSRHCHQAGL